MDRSPLLSRITNTKRTLSSAPYGLFGVKYDTDGGVLGCHNLDTVGTPGLFEVVEVVEFDLAALWADGDDDFVIFVFNAVVVEHGEVEESVLGGVVVGLHDVTGVKVEFIEVELGVSGPD